jgi:dihydroflavonol-4-reductase
MRAAVTGATGFIGQRLAASLGRAGEVVALGLDSGPEEQQRSAWLARDGIALRKADICDADALAECFRECDVVFHLAAAQHEAAVPDAHFERVNVGGARAVLEACRRAGVRRLVYGSTIGVYGDGAEDVLTEQSPPRPANIYGVTKLAAERLLLAHEGPPEVSVGRISETYGPGDFRLLKLFRGVQRGRFPRLGHCRNWRQPIFVDDLVAGLTLLGEAPGALGHAFVLAGPEPITTHDMLEQTAAALGTRRVGPRLPMWPFMLTAVVLENTLGRVGIQPPIHRRRLDFFLKSFRFDLSSVRERVGFVPATPYRDGAVRTSAWYREAGLL